MIWLRYGFTTFVRENSDRNYSSRNRHLHKFKSEPLSSRFTYSTSCMCSLQMSQKWLSWHRRSSSLIPHSFSVKISFFSIYPPFTSNSWHIFLQTLHPHNRRQGFSSLWPLILANLNGLWIPKEDDIVWELLISAVRLRRFCMVLYQSAAVDRSCAGTLFFCWYSSCPGFFRPLFQVGEHYEGHTELTLFG